LLCEYRSVDSARWLVLGYRLPSFTESLFNLDLVRRPYQSRLSQYGSKALDLTDFSSGTRLPLLSPEPLSGAARRRPLSLTLRGVSHAPALLLPSLLPHPPTSRCPHRTRWLLRHLPLEPFPPLPRAPAPPAPAAARARLSRAPTPHRASAPTRPPTASRGEARGVNLRPNTRKATRLAPGDATGWRARHWSHSQPPARPRVAAHAWPPLPTVG
jgi:hypothetical protein